MMGLRRLGAVAVAAALSVVGAPLAGCGGSDAAKLATVPSGDMPSNGKWDGVYFSELYGNLHLVRKGDHIKGRWERPHKDKWGEIDGDVTGDLFKFTWSEYTRGLVGPNAKRTGKGYFKYKRPEGANVDDTIVGERGAGDDEVGDPWEAVKQRNIPPNPDSIAGSGSRDVGGGDWDTDSKEKGKAEPPSPLP
jgi:hypothetical protein